MQFKLEHPTLLGEEVVLSISGLFGNPELLHNGRQLIEKSAGTNIYTIKKDSGIVTIALEPKRFDPFPQLEIEGEKYPIGRKLNPFDYLIVALPMLLIFVGGAIGGILGFLASSINARIMRMPKSALERYGFCLASSIGASVTWYILALGLNMLLNPAQ
tara:strand:- start:14 stop:490 length:477 start_codon:yes stop_codon:yes gene_type:complete